MSTTVSPEELSALLDGELSPARASEVRQALALDATLQTEYARLEVLHRHCLAAAAHAQFPSPITLPANSSPQRFLPAIIVALVVPVLAIQRFAAWPSSFAFAVLIHAALLFVALVTITHLVLRSDLSSTSPDLVLGNL